MKEPWQPPGTSDPLTYTCTCTLSHTPNSGLVLLFYRYFASPPPLPSSHFPSSTPSAASKDLATFHTTQTHSLHLSGKIRIAPEGFNITVAGTAAEIQTYMRACMQHWSFAGLEDELGSEEGRKAFFKPSPGCACVFGPEGIGAGASVRVCAEITPMGVTDYVPNSWESVEELSPREFHDRCWEGDEPGGGGRKVLVDVRNHYESRIGYFVDPVTGMPALRPGVRRFGQWPQFVRRNMIASRPEMHSSECVDGDKGEKKDAVRGTQYLTYCTGGIRCEKGSRFLSENLSSSSLSSVATLKGGIQAYLTWMDDEIAAGRKKPSDSLFKGRNYVFDARGSTGLSTGEGEKVAKCHGCGKAEDRLSKCRSPGCHLVLVVCEACEVDLRCCGECGVVNGGEERGGGRGMCRCEREREFELWGDRGVKPGKTRRRKPRTEITGGADSMNIQFKILG